MKTQDSFNIAGQPRRSLGQKIRLLARPHRAAQRRRQKCETKRRGSEGFAPIKALAVAVALLATTGFSVAAPAAVPTPTIDEANVVFASGNYPSAIQQYEAILARKGYSAPVLFDLGNAWYRCGNFGEAILNYERAQVLAPRDIAIADNLRLAREKAGVQAPTPSGIENAARFLGPNALAWIGSMALAAMCLALGGRRIWPHFFQVRLLAGVAAVTLLATTTAFAIRWPEFDRAIVVTANAPALIAPASTAGSIFALKAGESVSTVKTHGPFILIRTSDGRAGWISEKAIGRVFDAQPMGG